MAESRHGRFKSFFHFFLPRGGNARQSSAMKGVHGGNDFEAAFVMTKFAGKLEQPFICFGAAIAEEHLSRPDELHQRLRQPALRLVIIEVRYVH